MLNYYKVKENPTGYTHLRVDFSYDLGGYNYFTGKQHPRGYYLTVMPVSKGNGIESVTAFTGLNFVLKTVKRQSKRAEDEAMQIAEETLRESLAKVLLKNNLELDDGEITW